MGNYGDLQGIWRSLAPIERNTGGDNRSRKLDPPVSLESSRRNTHEAYYDLLDHGASGNEHHHLGRRILPGMQGTLHGTATPLVPRLHLPVRPVTIADPLRV